MSIQKQQPETRRFGGKTYEYLGTYAEYPTRQRRLLLFPEFKYFRVVFSVCGNWAIYGLHKSQVE